MRSSLMSEDTEAILLVDACNAFNSLNRDAAQHNFSHICPSMATILINIYRKVTKLLVNDATLYSEEGTTQGDPLAMPMYALTTIPLINNLNVATDLKQIWYADDAAASGKLPPLLVWWDHLSSLGLPIAFGYHSNTSKTWLLTKEVEDGEKVLLLYKKAQISISIADKRGAAGIKTLINELLLIIIISIE